MAQNRLPSPLDPSPFSYVVGIDIGSQKYSACVLKPDKRQVHKPRLFANTVAGFHRLQDQLASLDVPAAQVLIGMEATSRYGDALFHFLQEQGYQLCLLHPGQTHQFAQRRGLRAKTDQLDAITIGHVLLSGEARVGYVPDELISSYRELVRLHTQLTDDIARYKNEIHALLQVQFPEFTQVFADPCRPTALAVLQRYPSAACLSTVSVEELTTLLRGLAPRHYGRKTAQSLIALARASVSPGVAQRARSKSMQILAAQLAHTRENLAQVAAELAQVQEKDSGWQRLSGVPEFGDKTVAVLRAELGDVARFQRIDQAVASAGLDLQIRTSGKWQGQAKLSKRGSGLLRRMLYLAAARSTHMRDSAFGAYYHRLVARGLRKSAALIAVMRKMLIVAVHLLKTEQEYDPSKVASACGG